MKRDHPSAEWLAEQIADAIAPEIGQQPCPRQVGQLAKAVLDRLSRRCGGAYIYIPSAIATRQAAIRADFNGRNAAEIAARHGVSERWVRQLTKQASSEPKIVNDCP